MRFIELRQFTRAWHDLGLGDKDLAILQARIMAAPEAAPIVPGTGGLRKTRFAPVSWRTGKRGATRVCYAYFKDCSIVVLAAAFSKLAQENLAPGECKMIKQLLAEIREELKGGE